MNSQQLLIQNANVIDGTGAPARLASVLVVGDKIQAVGVLLMPSPIRRFSGSMPRACPSCPG